MKNVIRTIMFSIIFLLSFSLVVYCEEKDEKCIGVVHGKTKLEDTDLVNNIYINDKRVFSIDHYKLNPNNNIYSKKYHKDDVLLSIMYYGYPYNKTNLREKYNLSKEESMIYTQYAIWYYVEGINIVEFMKHKYIDELIDISTNFIIKESDYNVNNDKELVYSGKNNNIYETNYIDIDGKEGMYIVEVPEGVMVMDEFGDERYHFKMGEQFYIVNDNNFKMGEKVTVKGVIDKPILNMYTADKSEYSNLISTEYIKEIFYKDIYIVPSTNKIDCSQIQWSDDLSEEEKNIIKAELGFTYSNKE